MEYGDVSVAVHAFSDVHVLEYEFQILLFSSPSCQNLLCTSRSSNYSSRLSWLSCG
jgi:hypothetical protein